MNCSACGTQLPDGSTFCTSCGARQGAITGPQVGQPVAAVGGPPKSRVAAGLLGIFLGGLGIHRFYLGYTTMGIIQILVSVFTCGTIGSIWGLIEGILILTKSSITTDASGRPLAD